MLKTRLKILIMINQSKKLSAEKVKNSKDYYANSKVTIYFIKVSTFSKASSYEALQSKPLWCVSPQ
jgi:hypothetical protein